MYDKPAGMTGTAETEEPEFYQIYKLEVVVIPTNRPVRRVDQHDLIYKTRREKNKAIIGETEPHPQRGPPERVGAGGAGAPAAPVRVLQRPRPRAPGGGAAD